MNLIKVVFFILFIIVTSFAKAQKPLFRHFSTDQGLSTSETYHVFQDSKGYIWISTTNGVSRFDGYTFQNFEEQDGLADNIIFETIEDYKGRIWFVGFNCKLSYYENGKIKPYPFNHAIETLAESQMLSVKSSFYIDRNDNVYLSIRYRGLIKISPKGVLTRLDKMPNNIADIFERDNKLLVAQHHGTVNKLNIDIKNLRTSFVNDTLSKAKNLGVFAVSSSDNKSIFVTCDRYLLKIYNYGYYEIRALPSRILWLSRDRDNTIWVCPFNGGAIALNENNIMGPVLHSYLTDNSVSSVLHDKEGGVWFSTLDDGVFYLPSHSTFSYVYPADLPDNDVLHVETGDNEIFVGTSNGFLSVIKNNKITNYPIDTSFHSQITALKYDRNNKQLIIGSTYTPYIFKNGKISPLINNKSERNKKYEGAMLSIKSIAKASEDTYWLGSSSGLSLVNVIQNNVLFNSSRDKIKSPLRISTLYRYPDGSLLIGSSDGLWIFKDKKFSKAVNVIPGLKEKILKIVGDSLGKNIWIATKGNGLYLKTNGHIYHFTRKEGLINNVPYDLCINKNELWLATSQGISCITIRKTNPFQFAVHNYTVDDGLASNQVFQIKILGNKILVVTNRGLTILDRSKFKSYTGLVPVYITRVHLMLRDTVLPNNAALPYTFNSISFSFVGISYQSISKIRYQYRLLGLDEEWHTTQNTGVSFPFLPPNQYEFQLRTINDNGKVTSIPVIQKFRIRPPFWQTAWFIIFGILSFLAAGFFIYRYRVKRIEKDNLIQQEINQYRQQALSKQMNPHFLFNSLNSIQFYIVKNDRVASSLYLSKFANLMRIILNNSQNQVISLNDELSALKLYLELESMRFKDRFEYTFEIDPLINQISTLVPPFIIQPFIENSIWHGLMNREGAGILKIRITPDGNILRCIVEDNGVGRQQAAEMEGKNVFGMPSKGISITETRLKLFDAKNARTNPINYTDLYDPNGVPEGTRVEILIPILN
jgi:ligand-binding sensor domain-containing protein